MATWEWDPATDTATVSDTAAEIFGLVPGAAIESSRQGLALIHPDDVAQHRDLLEKTAARPGTSYVTRFRIVRPIDGAVAHMEERGSSRLDDGTGRVRLTGVVLDVTERVRAEQALRDSEQRFRSFADAAPALLWISEPDGSCSFISHGWCEFTGQAESEALGFGWLEAVHPDDRPLAAERFAGANRQKMPFDIEYRLRRADGMFRWAIDTGRPRFGHDGEFLGFIGSVIEIHARKHAEQERAALLESERAARAEAERVNRLKDEFLATLSHELRTPLNAIMGWSHVLSHSSVSAADAKQGLDAIERNARAQTQMIEDLLDMSRIVSGKVRLDVQRVDLAEVIERATEAVTPLANGRAVRLVKVLDPHAGPVAGDPSRLQQVIWNLLTNAIRFTPKGGKVQIVLERVNSHLELSVSDNGEGIDPAFLPHVFDRFRQADASTTRRHGGLGLGLSIVKQLVELHGGSVRAKSPGKGAGATFIVSLPLAPTMDDAMTMERRHPSADPIAKAPFDAPQLRGTRVLIVDDDADARVLIERMLSDHAAEVLTASSAAEALELVRRERPDVLLSDIGMPKEDGYDLIRNVRALPPEEGGATPAVALTAFARSEDRRRTLMAGYQMHVAKPVDPAELLAVIASVAGRLPGVDRG
jgi:PAS domain S-box-containing protein